MSIEEIAGYFSKLIKKIIGGGALDRSVVELCQMGIASFAWAASSRLPADRQR